MDNLEKKVKLFNEILLQEMKMEVIDDYVSGRIEELIVKRNTLYLKLVIAFPKVLSLNSFLRLRTALMTYITESLGFTKYDLFFQYDDNTVDEKSLEEYYNAVVSFLEMNHSRYSILKCYTKSFNNSEITIFVANEDEIFTIQPLLNDVEKQMNKYGLKVQCGINVSPFIMSVQSMIDERNRKSTQEILERQKNIERNNIVEEKKERTLKRPKATRGINGQITSLKDLPSSESEIVEHSQKFGNRNFTILIDLLETEIKEVVSTKSGAEVTYKIYKATGTDNTGTIVITTFINSYTKDDLNFFKEKAVKGKRVRVYGYAEYDKYSRDVVLKINDIQVEGDSPKTKVVDNYEDKRVELHAHTKMSTQDSVLDVNEYVERAKEYGYKALAVTDHYNIHVLPDFYEACKNADIKPIFGVEGALVDEDKYKIAYTVEDISLNDATYVVYDLETTGLSSNYNEIIEIAACKVHHGMIIDRFSEYVKPKREITNFITELTSITNDDVRNAESIEIILPKFKEFFEGSILVAHNASFDNSHIYANLKRLGIYEKQYPTIDTLQLLMVRYGDKLKRYNLAAMAKFFDVELEQHHRAIYDAEATAKSFIKMLNDLLDNNITNYNQINSLIHEEVYKLVHPRHFCILAKNEIGKKNLYKIISDSHTTHFYRIPRILKKYLQEHREGLLIGSGCVNGSVFATAYEKSYEELKDEMKFYDYIEIQPPSLYEVLAEDEDSREYIKENIRLTILNIIKAAKELNKLLVVTGDVHHLTKDDKKYREIYIAAPMIGGGRHELSELKEVPSFHFMNTQELFDEFNFIDYDLAYEMIITNTNKIADQIEEFALFPKKLFAPQDDFLADRGIPSVKDETKKMVYNQAISLYGENMHPYILDRLEKELTSIIDNKFATIYYISYLLVKYSKDAGYVVGSRGSVGSSLVAYMMGITEVNALPPHYYCPKCHFTAIKLTDNEKKMYPLDDNQKLFDDELQKVGTGYDLPKKICPICHEELKQNGVDIPFETFLGFKGEKTPDIDLNFSGDFQPQAHEFCRTIFGVDRAFRAGTIGTIAEKTAYGYVKGYLERKGLIARTTEINQMVKKIDGVKRSTGQHPGGIVVIPKEIEYSDVIPIQYPADDTTAKWRTTHFDYHKFEHNLLKLDILGHDDPTMIRHLMNYVEEFPNEFPFSTVDDIPLTDREVFKLFSGLESLHLTPDKTFNQTIGTTGIPEFGTSLAKDMLNDIRPTTVDALLKVSGLSHGKGVWAGNAKDFMMGKNSNFPKIPFDELIGCRDDIMVYLVNKKMPASDAFAIMESVRKGKGVSKENEKKMLAYNVPEWYIASCKLIQYMFPKAHATAYVIMALRIGWFKVHRPIFYYAGFFSRRADAFDVEVMARGYEAIRTKLVELDNKIKNKVASNKEIDVYATLLLAIEMTARGMKFKQMNIFESEAINFKISDDRKTLLIPFGAMDSLGEATAKSIVEAREERMFSSKKDVLIRTKLNSTLYEKMNEMGVFDGLPEDDQIGLF